MGITPLEQAHRLHRSFLIHPLFAFWMRMWVDSPTGCCIYIPIWKKCFFDVILSCINYMVKSSSTHAPYTILQKSFTFMWKSERIEGHWLLVSLCLLGVCGGKKWSLFVWKSGWLHPLSTFECGCGNGWSNLNLSSKIASLFIHIKCYGYGYSNQWACSFFRPVFWCPSTSTLSTGRGGIYTSDAVWWSKSLGD